jgi:3',5'-cyclic AMP phosphodiesterase CpdA
MKTFRVMFLADSQIGMYATFSGLSDVEIAGYAANGLRVWKVPKVEGLDWDIRQYEKAIDLANAIKPDLVLMGGDMVDEPDSTDQIDAYFRVTGALDEDIPMRWAPGNHDIAPDTVIPTPESIAAYRSTFGPDYYVFDMGPASFAMLNTVVIDHPEQVPGEWEAQQGFIAELAARPNRERPLIAIGHHPLFVDHATEEDTYWNLPAERRLPVLAGLKEAGVQLALAGHWHRNSIARDDEFEMVTSGPVGYPLGDDPSGFRMIEITEEGVSHHYLPLPD